MIAFLFLSALVWVGQSAPADPLAKTNEAFDPENFDSMSDEFAELRKGNRPECASPPVVQSAFVISGSCRYQKPSAPARKRGGKATKLPALVITIEAGATECAITIISDAPGVLKFLAPNINGSMIPSDAQMMTEDDFTGPMVFKKKEKPIQKLVGWSRATTNFKYTATNASAVEIPITVISSCVEGCHANIYPKSTSIAANIIVPPAPFTNRKNSFSKIKKMCEFWIKDPTLMGQVILEVTEFAVGRLDNACSAPTCKGGKVMYDLSGNKFYSTLPQTKCGKLDAFNVTSSGSTLTLAILRNKKTSFSAKATLKGI